MSFARKNLRTIGRLALPEPTRRGGPSPFFKLLIILSGILTSSLLHDKLALALLLVLGLVFAFAWRVRPWSLLRRLGPPMLLFGVMLPLPAMFIPTGTQEPILFWIIPVYPHGFWAAITLCLRTSAAISWAGAGFLTEEPHAMLSAMPLPPLLSEIILGGQRYISLIAREAWEMFLGRIARDPVGGFRSDISFLGSRVGLLFVRSADTGEKVYLAMKARGHPGVQRSATISPPSIKDVGWIVGFGLALSVIIYTA